ncbi:hypothetical protein [Brevibacillus sp. MS2.2]|uniref:hypothetical protein n=1 Tax=Brevibacillus sp. MS2.2 TaxID=2738981 RepID=UPI0020C42B67|nr:hypothetical protein [Brevibacillus sp. MS2.2]
MEAAILLQAIAIRKTEQKISVEEAKKKAIAALAPYLDPAVTELSLIVETPEADIPEWVDKNKLDKEEDKTYSFTFHVKRNGIEVSDESYMVRLAWASSQGWKSRTGAGEWILNYRW